MSTPYFLVDHDNDPYLAMVFMLVSYIGRGLGEDARQDRASGAREHCLEWVGTAPRLYWASCRQGIILPLLLSTSPFCFFALFHNFFIDVPAMDFGFCVDESSLPFHLPLFHLHLPCKLYQSMKITLSLYFPTSQHCSIWGLDSFFISSFLSYLRLLIVWPSNILFNSSNDKLFGFDC